jgi:hypothetical protein
MPLYTIERWDSVITKDSTFPFPLLYIKNSEEFENYARQNNFMFTSIISGTDLYDNKPIICFVNYPLDRPNFFKETGLTTIVLFCNWIGYPNNNGKIFLRGLEGPDKIPTIDEPIFTAPVPVSYEGYQNINNNDRLYLYLRISIFVVIGIILLFIILFLNKIAIRKTDV